MKEVAGRTRPLSLFTKNGPECPELTAHNMAKTYEHKK